VSRRTRDGRRPAPLFEIAEDGDITPGEARDNPRVRPCPACGALAKQRCQRRSRGGWVGMDGYHASRLRPGERPLLPEQYRGGRTQDRAHGGEEYRLQRDPDQAGRGVGDRAWQEDGQQPRAERRPGGVLHPGGSGHATIISSPVDRR
jgi:hypothetical protein